MSKAQDSQPARGNDPAVPDQTPDHASRLVMAANGENFTDTGIDKLADPGGHTLLARPSASQGRRSLFRR